MEVTCASVRLCLCKCTLKAVTYVVSFAVIYALTLTPPFHFDVQNLFTNTQTYHQNTPHKIFIKLNMSLLKLYFIFILFTKFTALLPELCGTPTAHSRAIFA